MSSRARSPRHPLTLPTAGALALVLGLGLTACGGSDDAADASAAGLTVATSFYPLQFATERIAGDRATVTNLTKPGAEPHDLELTARQVAEVSDADLVVYLSDFQPSVDDAVATQASDSSLDVASAARLEEHDTADEDDADHADEDDADHADHDHGGVDPHFWLDPTRLSEVAAAIADRLTALDPDGATTYAANLTSLESDLAALDEEFATGLEHCASTDLVTSHEAFGYLAERYGLEQIGITGLTPDQEPSAGTLADVATFVREHDVRTIYYETLVSPAIAETVAAETGAATAVLDPIEGLTDESAGSDYLEVMRANLAALRAGQPCS